MAFQIVDDILDCSGDTIETGKVAGTDLREGTPTLPLLLAAREDDVVRRALAGGPVDDALVRVASTGALERSRDVALDYARRARELLRDEPRLEALTHIVIERKRPHRSPVRWWISSLDLDQLTGLLEVASKHGTDSEAVQEDCLAVLVLELLEDREAPNPHLLGARVDARDAQRAPVRT